MNAHKCVNEMQNARGQEWRWNVNMCDSRESCVRVARAHVEHVLIVLSGGAGPLVGQRPIGLDDVRAAYNSHRHATHTHTAQAGRPASNFVRSSDGALSRRQAHAV